MNSKARLQSYFSQMEKFSLPGEGITRLAFSAEYWQALDYTKKLMHDAGLQIRQDEFGNIIGRRQGQAAAAPAVMCGSHIDSVPNGGNYDGVLGVLGAIECINRMNESGYENHHPIDISVYICEESSRFGTATLGSRAMCGELSIAEMKKLHDKNGKSLYAVLKEYGFNPDKLRSIIDKNNIKATLEMHIEQGCVLENLHKPIGIVTGIAAPTRLKAYIHGRADHSGATPMHMRHDALCAAAEIILSVEKFAASAEKAAVGTVGIINAKPNVMNVIPGETEIGIDLRSIYADVKDKLRDDVKDCIAKTAQKRQLDIQIEMLSDERPVQLADSIIKILEQNCINLNIPHNIMPSGAGHDTMHLAQFAPSGMIFIPCRGGISHNPAEYASMDDILTGVDVLYHTLCQLAAEN